MGVIPEKFVQGKKGLQIPIKPNSKKGLATEYGDDQLIKLLISMISDNSSENAFEDLNIFDDVPFTLMDKNADAFIRSKLQRVSEIVESMQRAKLLMDTIKIDKNADTGDFNVFIAYVNLETQKQGNFNVPIGGA